MKSDLAPRCVTVGFYVRSSSLQPTQLLRTALLLLHLLVSERKVGFHNLPADIGRGELISALTRSFRLLEVLRLTLFCEAFTSSHPTSRSSYTEISHRSTIVSSYSSNPSRILYLQPTSESSGRARLLLSPFPALPGTDGYDNSSYL